MTTLHDRLSAAIIGATDQENPAEVQWTVPKRKDLGDLSTNFALIEGKKRGVNPREFAEQLCRKIEWKNFSIEKYAVAGAGFINVWISPSYYHQIIRRILREKSRYGSSTIGKGQKILVEYVSANPTGPLNIVSARAAAIGDSLVRVLKKAGFKVASEFYINDAGRQIQLLGESILARARGEEVPEDGYHGEDIVQLAKMIFPDSIVPSSLIPEQIGRLAALLNVREQCKVLDNYGVRFDRWFLETELHEENAPQAALELLKLQNAVYSKDGATWFAGTRFGDNEDRVIITSEGRPTYLLPDIAYHLDKAKRGFDKAIDLLGPDHFDYIGRMQAAMEALGHKDFLEVLIVQQVHLVSKGEKVKMSKRAGRLVTLEELVNEVGRDVARFFFLQRRTSTPLEFDLDLAKEQSERNPVFYVQYAHTRICGILRQDGCPKPDPKAIKFLREIEEIELIKHLELFPKVIEHAARNREPQRLVGYLHDLATIFHKFYTVHRVVGVADNLSAARAALVEATRIVLAMGLRLLGIRAPKRM